MGLRAPDGWGVWAEGGIGFGRTLFQTTPEPETAPGPLVDHGLCVAGDIRLDDREALAGRLGLSGPEASSLSDSALILRAYRRWDKGLLDHISGDFAFALWDTDKQRLIAARDHFGIVPLYYAEAADLIIVSNDLRPILDHPQVDDTLCEQTIAGFLAVGMRTNPEATFYSGVKRLAPGCSLEVTAGDQRIVTYWAGLATPEPVHHRRPSDYVEAFREIFERAVRDRLRGQRACVELSGGMDSSSIAVTLAHQMGSATQSDLLACNFYWENLIADEEGRYAKSIAAANDMPLEQIELEALMTQADPLAERLTSLEPSMAPPWSSAAAVRRRAARHGRVLFSGLGGDPLFAPSAERPASPPSLTDVIYCWRTHGQRPQLGMRRRRQAVHAVAPTPLTDCVLNPEFSRRTDVEGRRTAYRAGLAAPMLGDMITAPLWRNLLDAADMGTSTSPLKVRFPFFDLRLVNFVGGVPASPWIGGKMLLRLAMRERLSQDVRRRPKTGLAGRPFQAWVIRHGAPSWMRSALSHDAVRPYIDGDKALALLERPETWDHFTETRLHIAIILGIWLQTRAQPRINLEDVDARASSNRFAV